MPDRRYQDADWLETQYHDNHRSTYEIADLCGVTQPTISKWLNRHDLIDDAAQHRQARGWYNQPVPFFTYTKGYERWEHSYEGHRNTVRVHRLLAVAEHGFDAVAEYDDVHHKNHIPWDNRPENIELLDHAEHSAVHHGKEADA